MTISRLLTVSRLLDDFTITPTISRLPQRFHDDSMPEYREKLFPWRMDWSTFQKKFNLCVEIWDNSRKNEQKIRCWETIKASQHRGPSGEIRTPGILNPKAQCFIFLSFYTPFSGVYSERSCFPELYAPLFPSVRILSMVKNVVKSKHSPKGSTFRGAFSSSGVS